jgi:hypothetical protein
MTLQRWISWAASAAAIGFLAACGGNAAGTMPSSGSGGGSQPAKSSLRFTIRVPHAKRGARGARYISSHTQSMAIAIATSPGGVAVTTIKLNLTPTTGGCAPVVNGTLCTVTASVKPGTYTLLVDTYDALNQGGKVLSEGQTIPTTVTAGEANKISLVLGGVPHTLAIAHGSVAIHGTQASGFKLYGKVAQPLTVTATDADGETIVGTDSLHYSTAVTSGTGWSVQATPNPATPNTFSVTPPGKNASVATLKVTFGYTASTCAESGAVCTASFTVTNDIQILAVAICGTTCSLAPGPDNVAVYALPNVTTPIATVTNGVLNPLTVAVGADGTLYVANCKVTCGLTGADTVTVYAPPYTGAPTTITSGVNYPALLAVDTAGDLLVDDCQACQFAGPDWVTEYAHGSLTTLANTLLTSGQINALTTDPANDALMAVCANACGYPSDDSVTQYASPFSGSPTLISDGVAEPTALAIDTAGNLYVANCSTCITVPAYSVTKYAVPYSGGSNPTLTLTGGSGAGTPPYVYVPQSVATDSANNLFVGNAPGGTANQNIAEFLAPSYGGNGTLFLSGYQPYEMRVDGYNDIIESSGDTVELSAYPYTTQTHVVELGPPTNQAFAISP